MKTILNRFIKENKINIAAFKTDPKPVKDFTIQTVTKDFSKWLSGYIDEKKTMKRFQSTYRVNKFQVRKHLERLAA